MYSEWKEISEHEHDDFIKTQYLCNLLQSCAWAQVKDNWKHVCIGVFDEGQSLVASSLVLIKKLPLGFTLLYIPRGPILNYNDENLVIHAFTSLKIYGRKMHGINIIFDPCLVHKVYKQASIVENNELNNDELVRKLHTLGVIHAGYTMSLQDTIQPRYNASVWVNNDFESAFPRHTKRHLKKAKKSGLVAIQGRYDLLDDFAHLMKRTEERKHIHLRDRSYFKKILDVYDSDAEICIVYLNVDKALVEVLGELQELSIQCKTDLDRITKLNKKAEYLRELSINKGNLIPCAGALYVRFHKTCEMLYMGMDYDYHNYMPAFVSHVEAMRWANKNNCDICNMGGIEPDMKGGLFTFKNNFSPVIYEYIGEFIYPINPFMNSVYQMVNRLRLKWKRANRQ